MKFTSAIISFLVGVGSLGIAQADNLRRALGQNDMKLAQVPTNLHRLAAEKLQTIQGTEVAPTWTDAVFAEDVRRLGRPDVDGDAYLEFAVLVDGVPSGYILVSTGPHDDPVPQWSSEDPPITFELDELAARPPHKYMRFDAFSYVAEAANGDLLAQLGNLIPDLEGLELDEEAQAELANPNEAIVSFEGSDYVEPTEDDSELGERRHLAKPIDLPNRGREFNIVENGNSNYKTKKENYKKMYEVPLLSTKNQAKEKWELEKQAEEAGEGLIVEKTLEVALLFPVKKLDVSGPGEEHVSIEVKETPSGRVSVLMTATGNENDKDLTVEIDIHYTTGKKESRKFVVLSEASLDAIFGDNRRLVTYGSWSSFAYAWAAYGQRWYDQFMGWPNTSTCYSGCGATAWAMLFGWADYRASVPNSGWNHRFGIYRYNGGYGSNVVAPKYMDTGVKHMTWEIRGDIGTWCSGTGGWTNSGKMYKAQNYLTGRTGATISSYHTGMVSASNLVYKARDSIKSGKPAAVGYNSHFAVAYGYRFRYRVVYNYLYGRCSYPGWCSTEADRDFYVNNGWGGSGNTWISSNIWWVGLIQAN